jgi:hypothetical protein
MHTAMRQSPARPVEKARGEIRGLQWSDLDFTLADREPLHRPPRRHLPRAQGAEELMETRFHAHPSPAITSRIRDPSSASSSDPRLPVGRVATSACSAAPTAPELRARSLAHRTTTRITMPAAAALASATTRYRRCWHCTLSVRSLVIIVCSQGVPAPPSSPRAALACPSCPRTSSASPAKLEVADIRRHRAPRSRASTFHRHRSLPFGARTIASSSTCVGPETALDSPPVLPRFTECESHRLSSRT